MANHAVPVPLRALRGNPSKTPMPKEIAAPPLESLAPPDWLAVEAKNIWIELAPTLSSLRLLTTLDAHTFAVFCATYATWKDAKQKADTAGVILTGGSEVTKPDGTIVKRHGRPRINPYVFIANQQALLLARFCKEFGLTPSARASLGMHGFGGEGQGPEDAEDAWIQRRRLLG